jgi:hypothetical protein
MINFMKCKLRRNVTEARYATDAPGSYLELFCHFLSAIRHHVLENNQKVNIVMILKTNDFLNPAEMPTSRQQSKIYSNRHDPDAF